MTPTPTAPEVTRLKHFDWWCEYPHDLDGHWEIWVDLPALRQMVEEREANAELIQWAQQNPEAWEALRTGRAGVYGDLVLRDKLGFEYTIRERLDTPFKNEVKEGV